MCGPTILQKTIAQGTSLDRLSTDVSSGTPKETASNEVNDSGYASTLKPLLLVATISVFVLEFSLWFPFNIPGVGPAALETYVPAWYRYDAALNRFDNSPWTYNTDYLLTAVVSVLAVRCLLETSPEHCPRKDKASLKLRLYSASLLMCYAISTLAGGRAHQRFTSVASLNTTRFWMYWCVCVGNVSFASCYMGLIGREVQRYFGMKGVIPLGPWWFWPVYGSYMAAACFLGCISFKRPACDIFIAGITQFPSTFYCVGALGLRRWPPPDAANPSRDSPIDLVRLPYRVMFHVGFIGNAPLLPMYPLLVQCTGMSLAGINTLLHSWLMVMWGMQGISLLHLCKAMSSYKLKASRD